MDAYDVMGWLRTAFEAFRSNNWYGSGSPVLLVLRILRGYLVDAKAYYKAEGQALLTKAQIDAASAEWMGDAADMQAQIADLEQSFGVQDKSKAALCQLAIRMIDDMIEMVIDGSGEGF
jgi:hypothetical protein